MKVKCCILLVVALLCLAVALKQEATVAVMLDRYVCHI